MPAKPTLTLVEDTTPTAGFYAAEALNDLFRELHEGVTKLRDGSKRAPGIPGTLKALNAMVQAVLRTPGEPRARGLVAAALIEEKVREAYRMPA